MQMQIMIFGQLTDITGGDITIDYVENTNALVEVLTKKYPALATTKYAIAVDKKVIKENTSLTYNITVALLPPFSGG